MTGRSHARRGLRRRPGFSLLEVLLAMGILLGSAILLGELASIGRKDAESAQDLAKAQLLCETRLNEILAGLRAAEPVESEPIEGQPDWVCTVQIKSVDQHPHLAAIGVTVARSSDRTTTRRAKPFTLVRWISTGQVGHVGGGLLNDG